MRMFLLKSCCLLALMSISVLAGIQIADNGVHHMKGKNSINSLYLPLRQGKDQQPVPESDPYSHDIQVKKQSLEQMNRFNFFSFIGKKMSEGISNTSAKIIKSIVN